MKARKDYGGVSLFIVIFVAMIVTVITVSFTQLMIRTQEQTTESDLSQRAYDSALAGVEDAKRVIITCHKNPSSTACRAINRQKCDTIQRSNIARGTNEVRVGKAEDNQAYTCVKIDNSGVDSYTTEQIPDEGTTLVPLTTEQDYNTVTVTWYTSEDAGLNPEDDVHLYGDATNLSLPAKGAWGDASVPPILRVAFIKTEGVAAGDLTGADVQTGFLYPFSQLPDGNSDLGGKLETSRRSPSASKLNGITCADKFSRVEGVCQVTFRVPHTKAGYLQLTPLYHNATVTIQVSQGGTIRSLTSIASVDSTGRADGLFRRVKADVVVTDGASITMPEIYVNKNLCKTFTVTDDRNVFDPGLCDPTTSN